MADETPCAKALRIWSLGQYPFDQALRTLWAAGPSEAECALTAFNLDFAKAIASKARSDALIEAARHIDGRGFTAVDKLAQELRALAQAHGTDEASLTEGTK